jgi:hypothetical protein
MTISAIRSLLNTAAAKHGIKISLKVGSAREEDAEAALAEPQAEA